MVGKWNWSGYRTTGIFQSITPYRFTHCDRVRQHKKQMSHFWLWLSTIEHNKGVLLRYSDHSLIRCILMLLEITILDGDHKLYFLFRLNNREIQNSPEWLTNIGKWTKNRWTDQIWMRPRYFWVVSSSFFSIKSIPALSIASIDSQIAIDGSALT